MTNTPGEVPMLILRVATQVVDGIQQGIADRGFADVRPAHGFAFVKISRGGCTVADLAAHLGVTKQSSSQLVEQLLERGYVTREPNPDDGRSWLLTLSERGWACTRAAEAAAADVAAGFRRQLSKEEWACLRVSLETVMTPGLLRPSW